MTVAELIKYKDALKSEYEQDLAAVDRLIARLRSVNGGVLGALAEAVPTPTLQDRQAGPGRPPGMLIKTVEECVHKSGGTPFTLAGISQTIAREYPASRLTNKAISSALGRMKVRGDVAIVEEGINGRKSTVYAASKNFLQAR